MIVFNQAHSVRVEYILDLLEIRGYTWLEDVKGCGTTSGEPRKGTHTWPEMNSSIITVIADEMVGPLLEKIKKLDENNTEVGIRAFVWKIEEMY